VTIAGARRSDDIETKRRSAGAGTTACLACGSRSSRPLFTTHGYCYVECTRCRLAHLDPVPEEHEARAIFDDSYFTGGVSGGYDDYLADEALHRANAQLRLAILNSLGIVPPRRLLDIGCAHGFFLDEARGSGWCGRGVDVSSAAAAYASRCFGLHIAEDLAGAAHGAPYDVVTLFQVLEHVASPLQMLEQAHGELTPTGTLMIETWDRGSVIARLARSQWQVVAPPSVVWLWDRRSLAVLLGSAGFDITSLRRTTKQVSLRFVSSLLNRRGDIGRISRLLERSPLRDRSLRYNLGDLITITATPRTAPAPAIGLHGMSE
jgi:SAM-dependent methyltransferase